MLLALELGLEPRAAARMQCSSRSMTASIRASRRASVGAGGCVLMLRLPELVSAAGPCAGGTSAVLAHALHAAPEPEATLPGHVLLPELKPCADGEPYGPEALVGLLEDPGDSGDPPGGPTSSWAACATMRRPRASATHPARASLRVSDRSGMGGPGAGCESALGACAAACWEAFCGAEGLGAWGE